jgi:hypothetical protein
MTLGGFISAERRVKEYEDFVRKRNRALARSSRAWSDLEEQEHKYGIERRESGEWTWRVEQITTFWPHKSVQDPRIKHCPVVWNIQEGILLVYGTCEAHIRFLGSFEQLKLEPRMVRSIYARWADCRRTQKSEFAHSEA